MDVEKIVNKGKVWAGSGRRRGVFGLSQEINRELSKPKPKAEVFESMDALMKARRK